MTWFKVDDTFHSHPKVLATEPAALGLWVIAGAWCSSSLTDGFVPDYALARLLPGSDELARKLVASGLWRRAKGGYRFHDWNSYNPSSETVKADREAARNRMRDLRKKRDAKRIPADEPDDCSGEQEANVRAKFGGSSQPRPDPTRTSSYEEVDPPASPSGGAKRRPTRLPEGWQPSPRLVAWARDECPGVDGRYETQQFIDYWLAKGGKEATKVDWDRTFQRWFRESQQKAATASKPRNGNRLVGADSRNGSNDWSDPKAMEF